ncbi:hypothetical protein BJ546DRAFT_858106, partial [Cryomyces antarcticus]
TLQNEKAVRYIGLLDTARCKGNWQEIPELARKIEKHAPHRKCLALTARSEAQVAAFTSKRPDTSASAASSTPLAQLVPPLLAAIEQETAHQEDVFQATICLSWIHWTLDEPELAIAHAPKSFAETLARLFHKGNSPSGWTVVCAVEGAYVKGISQEELGSHADALDTYNSVLPYLSLVPPSASSSPQGLLWTERLLTRPCLLSSQTVSPRNESTALRSFRAWAKFWQSTAGRFVVENSVVGQKHGTSRRYVWKAYYDTLSSILQQELVFAPSSRDSGTLLPGFSEDTPEQDQVAAKLQQWAELKQAETSYEGLLLEETRFPKASQTNGEVEVWVESVIANWRVLCGPTWQDEELGEGGKGAVGRGVLDILYRAATKSFHSTQILRHLFTVHTSLGEFDLAFKAFDSYVEIITRGKARAEKSGEPELGLDDDDTVLRMAAEAIRVLCRFGSHREAEKAVDIGTKVVKWLEQNSPAWPSSEEVDYKEERKQPTKARISPKVLALAYRAVGISQAHWSRVTYDATARPAVQAEGLKYLRKALDPRLRDDENVEALYSHALLLAETRDIGGALQIVKRALSPPKPTDLSNVPNGVPSDAITEASTKHGKIPYARERQLMPLWHLLALLLSARAGYDTAAKSCEAAFDQFSDLSVLFGDSNQEFADKSSDTSPAEKRIPRRSRKGLVDQMGVFERERLVQIKMTQLALVEVSEGASTAVDASDELLGLYARLFPDTKAAALKVSALNMAVASSINPTGSVRSTGGSILGRARTARRSGEQGLLSAQSTIAPAAAMNAPTIQVTNEHGVNPDERHHHHHLHLPFHHKHHDKTPTQNGGMQPTTRPLPQSRAEARTPSGSTRPSQESTTLNAATSGSSSGYEGAAVSNASQRTEEGPDQPLPPIAHNISNDSQPSPAGHPDQPPKQDIRLPAPFPHASYTPPDPHFATLQGRRQRTSLLMSVWLLIAGLYTRAAMFEDARGAIDEAEKLIQKFEVEVSQESSSSRAFSEEGWGGGSSVETLWARVWAERGMLFQTRLLPHKALACYERALFHFPDHPPAIVGLSTILLDIYAQVIQPESVEPSIATDASTSTFSTRSTSTITSGINTGFSTPNPATPDKSASQSTSPEELKRLTARDRAYSLLSALTKLGTGWDNSEAWFTLARAYEESGQVEKAKEVLWWCVELEDSKPLRAWTSVGPGGFVL